MIRLEEKSIATDLRTRGCPVCNHVIKTARDFFAQLQFALSSNEEAQKKFAAESGFCPRHTWQLHGMSSPWGESMGLPALTEEIARLLAKIECGETASSCVVKILRTQENCRVCAMLKDAEAAYVKRVATFISDDKGAQLYRRSQGVCLRHLAQILAIVPQSVREFLLTIASHRFETITQQMRDYAAKREAVQRHLITQDEEYASLRALVHLVGGEEYSAL